MKDVNSDWFEQNKRRENASAARFLVGVFLAVTLAVAMVSTLATVLQP
jgi:hypothetical protein